MEPKTSTTIPGMFFRKTAMFIRKSKANLLHQASSLENVIGSLSSATASLYYLVELALIEQ
jgi:hypothetical protein